MTTDEKIDAIFTLIHQESEKSATRDGELMRLIVEERTLNNNRFTQLATGLIEVRKEILGLRSELTDRLFDQWTRLRHRPDAFLGSIVDSHPEQPEETPGLMDNLQVYVSAHQLRVWYSPRASIGDEARARWIDVLHEAEIRILTTLPLLWGASQVHPK